MRLRTIAKLAILGGTVAAVLRKRRKRTAVEDAQLVDYDAMPASMAIDPSDLVQGFDEAGGMHLEEVDGELAVDVRTVDLDVEPARGFDPDADVTALDSDSRTARGGGDLYGVHTPDAADTALPDDDVAFADGENWVEALQTSATENGPMPERELDVVDEDDLEPPPTDTRDRPIADRGSAGPRGL